MNRGPLGLSLKSNFTARRGRLFDPRTHITGLDAAHFGHHVRAHLQEAGGSSHTGAEILDLKLCDPAIGSGAFLVEACRLLSEKLVWAWEIHKSTPRIPEDEDVHAYARRLVAERCLYGVDKNVFAPPFTFLDHSLRHGDSLVGLSREQIACFNWEVERQVPLLRPFIDARVTEAQRLREQIQGLASSNHVPRKAHVLRDAEDALADVRGHRLSSAAFEATLDSAAANCQPSFAPAFSRKFGAQRSYRPSLQMQHQLAPRRPDAGEGGP